MSKIAIVTDSNAGIHQSENVDHLFIVPMPFTIDLDEYYEDINLSIDEFYAAMAEDKKILSSQPSPGDLVDYWKKILESYDYIVHIPMSSALSKSYETAVMLSESFGGKVQVVDAKRISVTQKACVLEALEMAGNGLSAIDIKNKIESQALDASIYIMVDTLKFLKKGGRISPAVAAFGTLLHVKPILTIQGDKLDSHAKVMNVNQGKQKMINAIRKDIETRFLSDANNKNLVLHVAHTQNQRKAEEFREEIARCFPEIELGYLDELSLSVSCHIGPGALAIALTKKIV